MLPTTLPNGRNVMEPMNDNTDTYHPPISNNTLAHICYDFGYREGQINNQLWSDEAAQTLWEIAIKLEGEKVDNHMRRVMSYFYNIGYHHGSLLVWEDRDYYKIPPEILESLEVVSRVF